MLNSKKVLGGFLGGIFGGIAVDLIYISFAGPSGLFTLLGITERSDVFWSHAVLGGILGIIFAILLNQFSCSNIRLAGLLWGFVCLLFIGGIPTILADFTRTFSMAVFAILVWAIYGLILSAALKKIWLQSKETQQ